MRDMLTVNGLCSPSPPFCSRMSVECDWIYTIIGLWYSLAALYIYSETRQLIEHTLAMHVFYMKMTLQPTVGFLLWTVSSKSKASLFCKPRWPENSIKTTRPMSYRTNIDILAIMSLTAVILCIIDTAYRPITNCVYISMVMSCWFGVYRLRVMVG